MKYYYLTAGLAGMAVALYVAFACPGEPAWLGFILGYTSGSSLVTAITAIIRERRNVKPGRP